MNGNVRLHFLFATRLGFSLLHRPFCLLPRLDHRRARHLVCRRRNGMTSSIVLMLTTGAAIFPDILCPCSGLTGIAIGPGGDLFVVSNNAAQVYRYNSTTGAPDRRESLCSVHWSERRARRARPRRAWPSHPTGTSTSPTSR